jgi:hypothetical protein
MPLSDKDILNSLQHIEDEIKATLKELSSIKEEMDAESSEETARVFKFLHNLERLSFSKQFNPGICLQKHFGFSEEKAEKYLFKFIEGISEITQSSPPLNSVVSETSSQNEHVPDSQAPEKKRKGPKPYSQMSPEELLLAKTKKLEKAKLAANIPVEIVKHTPVISSVEPVQPKPKRVIKTKKVSDGIKIWNSFLKVVRAEVEATGNAIPYEDLVKKAKEMKEADPGAYELFSSTWTQEDDSLSSNA